MDLLGVEGLGQGRCGNVDHLVGHARGLGQDGAQAQSREDVDVVALVGVVGHGPFAVLDVDGGKGRARGEDDGAVGPLDGLLKGTLGLGQGVAEGEQDGAAADAARVDRGLEGAHDGLGEAAKGGGETDQGRRADVLDDLLEGPELVAVVVGAGKVLLVLGQLVAAVLGHETLGVDEPELVLGLLLGQAASGVVLDHLLGDTNTGGTCAHEDEALLLEGNARQVDSTNVTTENDGTSTLDVIVEALVLVAVAVEESKGLLGLKVLELNEHLGVNLGASSHELIHELLHHLERGSLGTETKVKRIPQVVLIGGTAIQNNWQGLAGVDTGSASV